MLERNTGGILAERVASRPFPKDLIGEDAAEGRFLRLWGPAFFRKIAATP